MPLRRMKRKLCASPVAAKDVEQNDEKAQEVTGKVRATKDPGESPRTMLPSRHLKNDRAEDMR